MIPQTKSELKTKIANLPDSPGVYKFFAKNGKLLYVGKSVSVKKRVSSYFSAKNLGPKTNTLVKQVADIRFIKVFSEFEALLLESEIIKANKPFFNTVAKDDKSPLYIKITNDPIPLVTVTRREKPLKGIFLKGPFPSAKTTREVLKMIRKIFPYCHHRDPLKPCLFVHLGLCQYPYQSEKAKLEYLDSIERIKKLLSGKSKALLNELIGEMKILSLSQIYEEAQKIKEQIKKLQYITSTYHAPTEFLKQPTLVNDLTLARLQDLKMQLALAKIPRRIECYDISNFAGTLATGSMVVFENGQKAQREYRRFKIKFTSRPNDYEMIKEVLTRRLRNNWPKPNLVIIDGGRGHLNYALGVFNKFKENIPVVAIAKRLETIHTPTKILPIVLPKDSPARLLVQTIRDEAHRFAITYHRLLRSKNLLKQNPKKT